MSKGSRKMKLVACLAITVLLLPIVAACAPTVVKETVIVEKVVEKPVEKIVKETVIVAGTPKVVEKVVTVTPAPTGPRQGGSIVWTDLEPNTMNPYIAAEMVARTVIGLANRGLVQVDPQGNWVPLMAAELPSKANGTVSEDGKTITWRLRPGLKWSDGTPLTSADIKFTVEAVSHPQSTATQTQGFNLIESVDTPDELTAVLHYKEFWVPWVMQFALGLLPSTAGDVADMGKWEWNRTLDPTNGPFMLKEWDTADHLTFVSNPNWYEEGKPYLDEILYTIVPEFETQRQMLKAGDNDIQHWLNAQFVDDARTWGVTIGEAASPYWFRVDFKLSERGDERPAPPAKPHAILGDLNVRKAIGLALNREDFTYLWKGPVLVQSMFYAGDFVCDLPPYEHSPEKAEAMLEEAGWIDQDGDGIRECHGCMYAEEGAEMRLSVGTYSGWGREPEEEVIIAQLKAVGIDAYADNVEATVLYGTYGEGSPARRGDFDLMWWDYELGVDPQLKAEDFYASWKIPTEDSPGGFNCTRVADAEIDEWLKVAGSTPDVETRREAYCNIARKLSEDIFPQYVVGVYSLFSATSTRVKGWEVNEAFSPYATMGWDCQNWYIEE